MSCRANAWDNAPMESFFKTLKVERIYRVRYETRAHARRAMGRHDNVGGPHGVDGGRWHGGISNAAWWRELAAAEPLRRLAVRVFRPY